MLFSFPFAMVTNVMLRVSIIVCVAMLTSVVVVLGAGWEVYAQQQQYTHNNNTQSTVVTNGGEEEEDPYLTNFNYGRVGKLDNGTTTRDFTLYVKESSQVPVTTGNNSGIMFPGWTFNGTIPGPTMRMTEGDLVRITVFNSGNSKNSHSMHMHSQHEPVMDGTYGPSGDIKPGENFTYTFTANPAGVYPYHCHVAPIVDHINRGLYGVMIIDPPQARSDAKEMVMMMNSYDFDLNTELAPTFMVPDKAQAEEIFEIANTPAINNDGTEDEEQATENQERREAVELEIERDNEMYTVNGKAFQYMDNPIKLQVNEPVRIYLVNMAEFDPVNNFHLHSDMFTYHPEGTMNTAPYVTDIVTLSQGDRGIIEFTPKNLGLMMFHAHVNEFTELGWMGNLEVVSG